MHTHTHTHTHTCTHTHTVHVVANSSWLVFFATRKSREDMKKELKKAVDCIVTEFLQPEKWGLIPRPT